MIKSFKIFEQQHVDTPILRIVKETSKPYDQITELDCSYKQLTSLEGIENLVNLKILNCSCNQLTSLKGIENLVNLKILDCYYNQLTSLKGIENLVDPRYLDCANVGIELVNLRELDCRNNKFSNDYKKYIRSLKIIDLKI